MTRTRPRCSCASRATPGGRWRSPKFGDLVRDHAERERDRAALPESVHAEARKPRRGVREVEVAGLVEELPPPRHRDGDLVEHGLELGVAEGAEAGRRSELAVDAQDGRLPDLQVDVAGAGRDGMPKHVVEIHGQLCIGTSQMSL